MSKHLHAEVIKAWADGAEIESFYEHTAEWSVCTTPLWVADRKYRIKQNPVITKMYMHYDHIERRLADSGWEGMQVGQSMFGTNSGMEEHIEFTFTDGKLTSVMMVEGKE